ncbi:hypothetical protein BDP67DRAFT_505188 [Colletotrichum lupini]|nr:hypothetical protein BDP67DRAFT_505188 [Colletotrichum lupini]
MDANTRHCRHRFLSLYCLFACLCLESPQWSKKDYSIAPMPQKEERCPSGRADQVFCWHAVGIRRATHHCQNNALFNQHET